MKRESLTAVSEKSVSQKVRYVYRWKCFCGVHYYCFFYFVHVNLATFSNVPWKLSFGVIRWSNSLKSSLHSDEKDLHY